ncbi:MAG: acetoacetate--CoA ligase [Actinobacteria bacterium]|nr:acetoacetate--CoA ligase [Actinomycetota bacterium]
MVRLQGVVERGEIVWTPSDKWANKTRLFEFANAVGFDELHEWSVQSPDEFWRKTWQFCGVVGEQGERAIHKTTNQNDVSAQFITTRFFPDAKISIVENFLKRSGNGEALVAIDETGKRASRTWDELRHRVASLASALETIGVAEGDRVVAWLPNAIEVVETMLAAASIGAIFSSCSPDFGAQGVLDRFSQITPKVLVATDSYIYGGKRFDCLERLAVVRKGLPSLKATLLVRQNANTMPHELVDYESCLKSGANTPVAPRRFKFDHPWYVLYSSGTTGVPKCIVHRTGGVLLQHLKEHQLHCDIKNDDRVMYFTTTGWMMWNWLVSVLASGATAVLYDGSPSFPTMNRLFDLVDQEQLTLLGTSAKFIDSARKSDINPIATHSLKTLRTICSTGSPLAPEGFGWVYEKVATDVHLASISGGTDICACFVAGDPTSSVHAGEIQRPCLGMDTDVVDDQTHSLKKSFDTAGELVCRQPFPSVPLGFWGDGSSGLPSPDSPGPKFRAAYFERFPGMWSHGDFASWSKNGGMTIHGRSDTTLNPGGVRIGTAEIYRVVEQHSDVLESLVFGQDFDNDVRIVLAVRLKPNAVFSDEIIADLKLRIRNACTPRHVPAVIISVADLPRTRSNKLVELAVADAVNGRPVRNIEAIANPEAITAIVEALKVN